MLPGNYPIHLINVNYLVIDGRASEYICAIISKAVLFPGLAKFSSMEALLYLPLFREIHTDFLVVSALCHIFDRTFFKRVFFLVIFYGEDVPHLFTLTSISFAICMR